MPVTQDSVLDSLLPLARTVSGLDLSRPDEAREALEQAHPFASLQGLEAALKEARSAGWLTPRDGGPGITFGRLARAEPRTFGQSIDAVDMTGAAAEHTHPEGEVSLCFVQQGEPRFEGQPAGWVVMPPGSHHTPTVTGGRMLILYFLPNGAMAWGPQKA